jgi:hypothetical protein
MTPSRANPSDNYKRMVELYHELHVNGEVQLGLKPEETYPGISILPHTQQIKEIIDKTGARTVLDYGCGKGYQYDMPTVDIPGIGTCDGIIDYWGVDEVHCYDPCVERFSKLPEGKFDGVVSTDVLEHCCEQDIAWIVAEMFGFANCFVFATVACYPAKTTLPDGNNAHTTIRPSEWWNDVFRESSSQHPHVSWTCRSIGRRQRE